MRRNYFSNRKKRLSLRARYYIIFALFLFFITFCSYFLFMPRDKNLLLVSGAEEIFYIASFDFDQRSLFLLTIPSNTQVDFSYSLGQLTLSSVWKLGEQEKIGGGELLVSTIRKNFSVPVNLWLSPQKKLFTEMKPFSRFRYFIFPAESNIGFSLRFKLFWFLTFDLKETIVLDLSDTNVLEKTTLKTGTTGFLMKDDLPINLRAYFRNPHFIANDVFVSIINESGNSVVVSSMEKVINVMGGSLISIRNENDSDIDCFVYSPSSHLAKIFSSVFGCIISDNPGSSLNNNEVVLRIGKRFPRRW